jgi:hypothetical protein
MTFNTELWNTQTPGAAGYEIERSLRFNSADSAHLSRTPSTAGNRKTWTWAGWVKFSAVNVAYGIFEAPYQGGAGVLSDVFEIWYSSGLIHLTDYGTYYFISAAKFRDPSAWQHFVFTCDTTQASASDRFKVYQNGVQLVNTASGTITQNLDTAVNNAVPHEIVRWRGNSANAYLADVHFIDGQALEPTDFGEFDDNGVWQPIEYAGTYGTNGFHLPFSDNSSASALGTDDSGNGNDWTVNNISAIPSGSPSAAGAVTAGAPFNSTYPWTTAFDGSITLVGAVGNAAGADSYKWTFGNTLTGTTAAFVVHDTWVTDFDAGNKAAINGTALTSSNWTKTTNTLPVASGSPGDYQVYTYSLGGSSLSSVGVSSSVRIAAVLLDGVPLIYDSLGTNDSLLDSPTNGNTANDTGAGGEVPGNYCTWNPLCVTTFNTLSNGNLEAAHAVSQGYTGNPNGTNYTMFVGTMGVTSGKWYWEGVWTSATTGIVGVVNSGAGLQYYVGFEAKSVGYTSTYVYNNGFGSAIGSVPSYAQGDIIGVAIDMDNGKLYFSKNGTFINSGDPAAGTGNVASGLTGETIFPAVSQITANDGYTFVANFGQRAFAYSAPSGYKALCTANLDTPTIADGSTAMDVALYTGNGSTQTISGLGFSPDFAWLKKRNGATAHRLFDTVRGATKVLYSNATDAEGTDSTQLSSFDSTGFTLGNNGAVNALNDTYVGWTWDAGSSTVSNTDGSITSSVRANPTAGFSIVTYTGNATTGATIGHGLNVPPSLVIVKNRDTATNWCVGHVSAGFIKYLELNTTLAATSASSLWNNTNPSSTVVTLGSDTLVNQSTKNHIAYCFAPVEGYSAFGSYTGNGLADGPFVYTGFRPRWVMVKRTNSTGNWIIWDAERSGYNTDNDTLAADSSNVENALTNSNELDILSNGFKLVASRAILNASAGTYIYAAFAEHPFRSSRAR